MSAESENPGYTCPYCDTVKVDEKSLKAHFTRKHTDEVDCVGKYPEEVHELLPGGSKPVQKSCKNCDSTYTVLERNKEDRTYCSRTCRRDAEQPTLEKKAEDGGWGSLTAFVRSRDRDTCQVCGCKAESLEETLHVHHIIPKAEGGPDNPSNLAALCDRCHRAVHSAYSKHDSIWSALKSLDMED